MLKKLVLIFPVLLALTANIYAIVSLDDIQVGGVYRMDLASGETLEGIIEEKDDSSVIIESMGTPYKFNATIIYGYTLIVPPSKKNVPVGLEFISFKELLHRSGAVGRIKILISNGTIFKGIVSAIDTETVKINVGGSIIPISKDLISQITKIPIDTRKEMPQKRPGIQKEQKKYEGPFDTVNILNPKTDEYGKHLPPLVIIGKIQSHDPEGIVILTPHGVKREFKVDRILRVIRNTAPSYEQKIKIYAKSLFCPANMILIDLPPGKEGRPFFKVCIDRYEYPNRRGNVPETNISYENAHDLCKKQKKRLCAVEEWQWSCSGLEGYTYPYGYRLEKTYCNRDGIKNVEHSGARLKCVGKFGVYDMVGNIFEWVTDSKGKPMLMGGPYSKCQTVSPGMSGAAKPQIGFRCCKSN